MVGIATGLDDIETAGPLRKGREALEEHHRRADQALLLAQVDGGGAASEFRAAAVTHFDEHDAVALAHHQVEFAETALRIGRDVVQPRKQKMPAGGGFDGAAACAAIEAAR